MPIIPSNDDRTLVREKQAQAIERLRETGSDAWLTFVREGSDPTTTMAISGVHYLVMNAAFIFTKTGRRIAILQPIDVQNKAGLFFDEIIPCDLDIDRVIADTLGAINPNQIAVNYSRTEFVADGLSHGMHMRLVDLLTPSGLEGRLTSAEDIIVHMQAVKTKEEIARMRRAAQITAAVADRVATVMTPGFTQRDMMDFFASEAAAMGADEMHANIATNPLGENDKGIRARPIRPGDCICSDMGAVYKGYHADLKRCWYVLKENERAIPDVLQRQWDACRKTLAFSVRELRAGRPGYEVHDATWEYMERLGFQRDRHSYGHQIGRRAHDAGPWLGERANPYRPAEGLLQENMVLTLDPTMNRVGMTNPGYYSMGIEEMGVVRKDRGRLLWPAQPHIFEVRLRRRRKRSVRRKASR